jgi:hypothetical protein
MTKNAVGKYAYSGMNYTFSLSTSSSFAALNVIHMLCFLQKNPSFIFLLHVDQYFFRDPV